MFNLRSVASFAGAACIMVAAGLHAACGPQTRDALGIEIVDDLKSPLKTPYRQFTKGPSWSVASPSIYQARHQQGHTADDASAEGGKVWEALSGSDASGSGTFIYGPYINHLQPDMYAAFFRIKLLSHVGEEVAATIECVSNYGNDPLNSRQLTESDLTVDRWVQAPLFFRYNGGPLECRVQWSGNCSIRVDTISLYRVTPPILDPLQNRAPQPRESGIPRDVAPITEQRPFPEIFPRSKPPDPHLVVIDVRKLTPDWQMFTFSLQGIVNRARPRIYCIANDRDHQWLDWMIKRGWVKDTETVNEPLALLERFRSSIKGEIITDPALPATANVATMLAGVEDAVVVSPQMQTDLRLPFTHDLKGRWKTNVEAYRWSFDNLWGKLNHHVIACSYPAQLPLRDYLIENKIFVFWLSGPIDGARKYADPQKELELMEELLAKMPVNIPVMSYPYAGKDIGIGEGPGVTLFAEFGKYLVGTTDVPNLSVHSGVPVTSLKQKAAPPTPELNRNKVYVSYIMSDGDNLPVLSTFNFPPLWADPIRGAFPVGWSASPSAIMLIPDIMDYYYSTASQNDLWLGAVSGIGYTYPDSYGLRFPAAERTRVFDGFLKQTNQYMQRMDEKILWPMNLTHPEMIARYADRLSGLEALFPDYGRRVTDYEDATYSTDRNVPVFCAVTRWQEHATDEEQIEGMVKDIRAMTPAGRPAFLHMFVWKWGAKMSALQEVLHRLGPEYVPVRPDQLAGLYRSYLAQEKVVVRAPSTVYAVEGWPLVTEAGLHNVSSGAVRVTRFGVQNGEPLTEFRPVSLASSSGISVRFQVPSGQSAVRLHIRTSVGDRDADIKVNSIPFNELVLPVSLTHGARLEFARHYPAVTLSHGVGQALRAENALGSISWVGIKGLSDPGFLVYGPYEPLPKGRYLAVFRLMRIGPGEGKLATLDTCVGGGSPQTAVKVLNAADLPENAERSVGCILDHPGGPIEVRVQWTGAASLAVESVTLWRLEEVEK